MRSALREDTQPWYKYPWPWILMSGPAIVVVACIYTIYLAFSQVDDPLMGGAQKRGLKVEPTIKMDQAKELDHKEIATPAVKYKVETEESSK